jgi:hypothetical protein
LKHQEPLCERDFIFVNGFGWWDISPHEEQQEQRVVDGFPGFYLIGSLVDDSDWLGSRCDFTVDLEESLVLANSLGIYSVILITEDEDHSS